MSLITPKTIVITAYPGKHGSISMQSNQSEYSLLDSVDFDSDGGGGPRKRRRLTHLSPDEKMLRRKLKNRVAAQTARDRKKALMQELEEKVAQLEEENKLLRRQNVSLKETSSSLAKENASLKSRLTDPVPTSIKTESEPPSTCCSSAEGAGSESVSMAGPVLRVCHDAESDDLFGLLQELTDLGECEQPQKEAVAALASSVRRGGAGGKTGSGGEGGADRAAPRGVVGLSPAELESLNELIHIDHYYVKPQPLDLAEEVDGSMSSSSEDEEEVTTSPEYAHELESSIALSTDEVPRRTSQAAATVVSSSSAGVKRTHAGVPVRTTPSPPTIDASLLSQTCTVGVGESSDSALKSAAVPPSPTFFTDTDDIMGGLSETEMEAPLSLNFLDDLVLDGPEAPVSKLFTTPEKSVAVSPLQPIAKSLELVSPELNSAKLLDEIYEHYLNFKDSSSDASSPLSTSISDPDLHGETVEALSPQSSEGSLLDDLSWHDSFTELFPDLQ